MFESIRKCTARDEIKSSEAQLHACDLSLGPIQSREHINTDNQGSLASAKALNKQRSAFLEVVRCQGRTRTSRSRCGPWSPGVTSSPNLHINPHLLSIRPSKPQQSKHTSVPWEVGFSMSSSVTPKSPG